MPWACPSSLAGQGPQLHPQAALLPCLAHHVTPASPWVFLPGSWNLTTAPHSAATSPVQGRHTVWSDSHSYPLLPPLRKAKTSTEGRFVSQTWADPSSLRQGSRQEHRWGWTQAHQQSGGSSRGQVLGKLHWHPAGQLGLWTWELLPWGQGARVRPPAPTSPGEGCSWAVGSSTHRPTEAGWPARRIRAWGACLPHLLPLPPRYWGPPLGQLPFCWILPCWLQLTSARPPTSVGAEVGGRAPLPTPMWPQVSYLYRCSSLVSLVRLCACAHTPVWVKACTGDSGEHRCGCTEHTAAMRLCTWVLASPCAGCDICV